jgi:hypothetical protein
MAKVALFVANGLNPGTKARRPWRCKPTRAPCLPHAEGSRDVGHCFPVLKHVRDELPKGAVLPPAFKRAALMAYQVRAPPCTAMQQLANQCVWGFGAEG